MTGRIEYKRTEVSSFVRAVSNSPGAIATGYEVHGSDGSRYEVTSGIDSGTATWGSATRVLSLTPDITTADDRVGRWVAGLALRNHMSGTLADYLNAQP